jgi:threonine/homoserine/homoserine lactone efflux protein
VSGDTLALFAQSAIIGLSIAAPVGPIGLLCIQRSLAFGPLLGFATGLGAAVADAIYAAIAAFGVAAIVALLDQGQRAIRLIGAALLLWIAWRILRTAPANAGAAGAARAPSLAAAFASTVALTLANPATIVSFLGVFAGLGVAVGGGTADAALVIFGVFVGSAAWWLALALGVGRMARMLSPRALAAINRMSAATLALFALWIAIAGLR